MSQWKFPNFYFFLASPTFYIDTVTSGRVICDCKFAAAYRASDPLSD